MDKPPQAPEWHPTPEWWIEQAERAKQNLLATPRELLSPVGQRMRDALERHMDGATVECEVSNVVSLSEWRAKHER
jgi:hypothetical protein